jgi:hypothetical protein
MQLVLGWPVDLEARRRLEAQTGRRLPAVYTGSVKGTCSRCGLEIWIGPRLQGAIETSSSTWPSACRPGRRERSGSDASSRAPSWILPEEDGIV